MKDSDYQLIFQEARRRFVQYQENPRATQECHPIDGFDYWIAQVAWEYAGLPVE